MSNAFERLRIADVVTFLSVHRHRSITTAARELRVTPSQVSKAIARLETYLDQKLLLRRGRGVAPTSAGRAAVGHMEQLVEAARLLQHPEPAPQAVLSVAAPSYVSAVFLPTIATAVEGGRVRGLELGPAATRSLATEGAFELALTVGEERMPASWAGTRVGALSRGLFAPPELAKRLGLRPTANLLKDIPFVCPIYNSGGQFVPGDDGCPLPRSERIVGHEAVTIGVALEVAAASGQLVFGPIVAARPFVLGGRLVQIPVSGWYTCESLFLYANADAVLSRVQSTIITALRAHVDVCP